MAAILGAWQPAELDSVFPVARSGHSAVLIGDRMVVFGGHGQLIPQEGRYDGGGEGPTTKYGNTNDVCMISLQNFKAEWLQPSMQMRIKNRVGHQAVNVEGDMYVFGGWAGKTDKYLNFGFLFDMKSQQLMVEDTAGKKEKPKGRRDHTLTLLNGKIYLFGGWNCVESYNDLWTLDFKNKWRWSQVNMVGNIPGPRRGHSATAIGTKLYIFGGIYGYTRFFNELYCLDTKTMEWQIPEVTGNPPSPRAWHSACALAGTPLIIFIGGSAGRENFYNDVYSFNTKTNHWRRMDISGAAPTPRCSHTAVSRGSMIYVFGGLSWQSSQLRPSSEMYLLSINIEAATAGERVEARPSSQSMKHSGGGDQWLEGWKAVQHLRKGTWMRSYFKITPGDGSGERGVSIRRHDPQILAEIDLGTPTLQVENSNEHLEHPLVMLLSQSKASPRVQEYLKESEKNLTDEYPEFYLAVEELERYKPGTKEFLSESQKVYNKFLRLDWPDQEDTELEGTDKKAGDEKTLTNVSKRDRDKIKKFLKSGKLEMKHWRKPQRSALMTMRDHLRDFLQNKQVRDLISCDKNQRACTQCAIKFDNKIKKKLCMYCLGVFCGSCLGNSKVSLPTPYKNSVSVPVCRVCNAILNKENNDKPSLATFCITGFETRKSGLFEEVKAKDKCVEPPARIALGVVGETERDLWVEAIRSASVTAEEGEEGGKNVHREGWVMCKPLCLKKNLPVVWTRKYAILDGKFLRLLDLKFNESLPLVQWEVHSFNTIEPTMKDTELSYMPSKVSKLL